MANLLNASPGSLELKDGPAFGTRVVWSTVRVDLRHASVLDAEFLAEQLGIVLELIVVSRQANAGVDAVGSPAASRRDGVVGQGDDVQDGGFDVLGPSGRQRNVWQKWVGQR